MATIYTIVERDGEYHIDPPHPEALTTKVFVKDAEAYIEPSGATPDGYFFPVSYVGDLLTREIISPYYYERAPEDMAAIEQEGIGFNILAESGSDEEDRKVRHIVRMTEERH